MLKNSITVVNRARSNTIIGKKIKVTETHLSVGESETQKTIKKVAIILCKVILFSLLIGIVYCSCYNFFLTDNINLSFCSSRLQ